MDAREGLHDFGWQEWPYHITFLGAGAFGTVRLVYRTSEVDVPLEQRSLAALKVQRIDGLKLANVWKELSILQAVFHPNIIDFYGAFVVKGSGIRADYFVTKKLPKPKAFHTPKDPELSDPTSGSDSATIEALTTKPFFTECWMLLEHADAGDLKREIKRYHAKVIPDSGARYYMIQICAGLQYLHSKGIEHNDLHIHNVLLKYVEGGKKKILICDFGTSLIHSLRHDSPANPADVSYRVDVYLATGLLKRMLEGNPGDPPVPEVTVSPEAHHVILMDPIPDRIEQLLQYPWFAGPSIPPIPEQGRGPVMRDVKKVPEEPPPFRPVLPRRHASGLGLQPLSAVAFHDHLWPVSPEETRSHWSAVAKKSQGLKTIPKKVPHDTDSRSRQERQHHASRSLVHMPLTARTSPTHAVPEPPPIAHRPAAQTRPLDLSDLSTRHRENGPGIVPHALAASAAHGARLWRAGRGQSRPQRATGSQSPERSEEQSLPLGVVKPKNPESRSG